METQEQVDEEQIVARFEQLCERMAEAGQEEVDYLKGIEYKNFLLTEYWDIVRDYRLYTAGFSCERCEARPRLSHLHVHHKYYDHHGSEHAHMEDLMVLCKDCHEREHRHYRVKSDLVHISLLKRLPPVLALLFGERR